MDKRYFYAMLTYFLVPLAGIGTDIYLPSLPSMVHYFNVPQGEVQLTVSSFVIAMAIGQLIAGPVSDAYGRKKQILYALGLQLISLFIILHTNNIYIVISARFTQGLGAALMIVPSRAILNDIFDGDQLKKHFNYLTISFAIGPIIAPFLGGYLEHYFGWHMNFWFIFSLVILAFLLTLFVLPETIREKKSFSIKHLWQNYGNILSHKRYYILTLFSGIIYGYIATFNISGPFILQNTLKLSAVAYGYIALFAGFAWFAGNLTNRMLFHVDGLKKMQIALLCTSVTALCLFAFACLGYLNLWVVAIPTYLLTYFSGIIFPIVVGTCLSLFPEKAASANACFFALNWLSFGIFTLIATLHKSHTLFPVALTFLLINIACQLIFYRRIKSL